jgi:hypothetical protein
MTEPMPPPPDAQPPTIVGQAVKIVHVRPTASSNATWLRCCVGLRTASSVSRAPSMCPSCPSPIGGAGAKQIGPTNEKPRASGWSYHFVTLPEIFLWHLTVIGSRADLPVQGPIKFQLVINPNRQGARPSHSAYVDYSQRRGDRMTGPACFWAAQWLDELDRGLCQGLFALAPQCVTRPQRCGPAEVHIADDGRLLL